MEEQGVTQADLARKMGVSRARVSQILSGSDNLTLKSIVAVAIGLDSRVDLKLKHGEVSRAYLPPRLCGPVNHMWESSSSWRRRFQASELAAAA